MSEKRFVQCEIEYGFANTTNIREIDGIYDMQEEKTYRIEQIVELLNELDDERMMYKTTIDKRIVELKEENEQLQKKYDNLNSAIEKTAMDMNEKRIYGREDFDVFQRITDYVEELDDE